MVVILIKKVGRNGECQNKIKNDGWVENGFGGILEKNNKRNREEEKGTRRKEYLGIKFYFTICFYFLLFCGKNNESSSFSCLQHL